MKRSTAAGSFTWRASAWIAVAVAPFWVLGAVSQGASHPAGPEYHIAGRVVNSSTGDPIARASVTAHFGPDGKIVAAAVSDADGRFSIDHLPAGKYPLSASKRGFRTAFYDEHESFNSAIVTGEGQDSEHLQFALAPAAILHGVVTGDGGDPVEGADVMLFRRPDPSHPSEWVMQVDEAITDDTGAYEFSNLPSAEYFVAVKAVPWYALHGHANRNPEGAASSLDVAYPITYFDSTVDEASAAPIALSEGGREEANVNLHAVPALHLRLQGTQPHRGTRPVELRETVFGKQVQSHGVLVIQQGTMETSGLAPGHYELTHGDPPRSVELEASSDVEVEANAGTPAVNVSGTLRSSTGAVVAEDANVILEPVDGAHRTPLQTFARKGQFQFDDVLPGRWGITVYIGADGQVLPVVSVTVDKHAAPGNEIAVPDQPVNVAIVVSRAQARVLGLARMNGKPASGVMVVLVPRAPGAYPSLVRRDQSDSDGSFSLRDVAPGQYTVIAIEDGWKLDWQRRETIARYLAGGIPVAVGERLDGVVQLPQPVTAVPR